MQSKEGLLTPQAAFTIRIHMHRINPSQTLPSMSRVSKTHLNESASSASIIMLLHQYYRMGWGAPLTAALREKGIKPSFLGCIDWTYMEELEIMLDEWWWLMWYCIDDDPESTKWNPPCFPPCHPVDRRRRRGREMGNVNTIISYGKNLCSESSIIAASGVEPSSICIITDNICTCYSASSIGCLCWEGLGVISKLSAVCHHHRRYVGCCSTVDVLWWYLNWLCMCAWWQSS